MPKRSDEAFHELARFCETLHAQIDYVPRSQPGVQSPLETAQSASGCCRDIAWLFIQATRRAGFASRFVSGYLVNDQSETHRPFRPGCHPCLGGDLSTVLWLVRLRPYPGEAGWPKTRCRRRG
ncbi:MAG: transglutaminase family protein [Candidatus Azotimanducaceae bacterium]